MTDFSLAALDDPDALLRGSAEHFRQFPTTIRCPSRFGKLPCRLPAGHVCDHVAQTQARWADRFVEKAVDRWEQRLVQFMVDGKGLPPDVIRRLILKGKLWPELRHVVEPVTVTPESYGENFLTKESFLVFCLETIQRRALTSLL